MIETHAMIVPGLFLAQEGKPPVIGGAADVPATGMAGAPVEGQAADGGALPAGATRPASSAGSNMLLFGMLLFFGFLVITTMMQSRKDKKRKAALLSSISKHDRVQTLGGIIGTVAELSDDEVVLRVDESSNSRVRVTRSSISQVLKKGRGSSIETEPKPEVETVS
jgi:preprotein translocase subunit YajC